LARAFSIEHPFDAGTRLPLKHSNIGSQLVPVQALAAQHTDLDFDYY
jgi:hypothetical protein